MVQEKQEEQAKQDEQVSGNLCVEETSFPSNTDTIF